MLGNKYDESIALLEGVIRDEPALLVRHHWLAETLLLAGQGARGRGARRARSQDRAVRSDAARAISCSRSARPATAGSTRSRILNRLVGVYDLPPPSGYSTSVEAFNGALAEELMTRHTRNAAPIDQTLHGGTQTPGYLFERPGKAVEGLQGRIREAVADYVRTLPDDPTHPSARAQGRGVRFLGRLVVPSALERVPFQSRSSQGLDQLRLLRLASWRGRGRQRAAGLAQIRRIQSGPRRA